VIEIKNDKLQPYFQKLLLEAGCDEAGRGCLAGPVVAAAVILPLKFRHEKINDSKIITEKVRYQLRTVIEKEAISYAIGIVDAKTIDKINILNASFLAMHKAIEKLTICPELLLIDGNRFNKYKNVPHQCIVKGDSKFMNIAAASILAKTYRDDLMQQLHLQHPEYEWQQNKGYPTKFHRSVIKQFGFTKHHRKTFRVLGVED
jgi:ribonuclease HII